MKIAILNDVHIGVRNSARVFSEYQERFFTDTFFPYLKKHKIKRILICGDLFDNRKSINFRVLNDFRRFFCSVIRKEGYHVDLFPGNHDIMYNNSNRISSLKELLGYYTDCITIHMDPTIVDYCGFRVAMIPWINESNAELTNEFLANLDPETIDLVAGHFELAGFELLRGIVQKEESPYITIADLKKFKRVISGHYHIKSEQKNITYLGSQMQFTWNDLGERKYFHTIDTKNNRLQSVQNPESIFTAIQYSEQLDWEKLDLTQFKNRFVRITVLDKGDPKRYHRFLDRMFAVGAHQIKIVDLPPPLVDNSTNDDSSQSVQLLSTQQIINQYVDRLTGIGEDINKEKLKQKLHLLYSEAVSESQVL